MPALLALFSPPASAAGTHSIAGLATANIGKKACSINSLGGRAFESSCTGNGGRPEYWCADFAMWVWANAGVADTSYLDADAGSFYTYGLDFGTLSATPAVGDAAVFDYSGGGVAEHVAIVTKVNRDGTVETVSGDWGGQAGSESHFASTSSVVLNDPAYLGAIGRAPAIMGMTLSAFVAPVGVRVVPIVGRSFLPDNGTLTAAHSALTSPNGLYSLSMQRDGNLVEQAGGRPVWATGTSGHPGARAVMQSDGNFVVYDATGAPLWASGTGGHAGRSALAIGDGGGLAVDGPSGVLWTRQPDPGVLGHGQKLLPGEQLISVNGLYSLAMQHDGNLVEYTAGRPLWATRTEDLRGAHAVMQADGNLVVYGEDGHTLWSSRTSARRGAAALFLQSGARVVVATPARVLWSDRV